MPSPSRHKSRLGEGMLRVRGQSDGLDESPRPNKFTEVFGKVFFLEHATAQFGEGGVLDLPNTFTSDV